MELLFEIMVSALLLSSMYVLAAAGFALVLSIMNILNFAHGAIYMVGGFLCYEFSVGYGLNQWLALALSAASMALFGLFLERFLFRRFYGDFFSTIIVSIAVIFVLQTTINLTVAVNVRALPTFAPGSLNLGNTTISMERLVTAAIGVALLAAMVVFVRVSRTGQQMLAVAQDAEGAALQGIRIHRLAAIAMAAGCATAAIAGSFMGAVFDLNSTMGDLILVKVMQVVILSGIGSLGGILIGGLVIGSVDSILPLFTTPAITQAVGVAIVIALLLVKPQGLFGREMG